MKKTKWNLMNKYILIFLITVFCIRNTEAQCPTPPTKTSPRVSVDIKHDKKKNIYTYTYKLENQRDALIPISIFFLQLDSEPNEVLKTPNWTDYYTSARDDDPSRLEFFTADQKINPNSSETFTIKSTKPPQQIKYYVQAITEPLKAIELNGDSEAAPDCPGFYSNKSMFDSMTVGLTEGPSSANQVKIKVKIKKNKSGFERLKIREEIRPYQETGLITLQVNSSKELDVSDIDISSLRFGVGKATPSWFELRPGNECLDLDDDKTERSKQKLWLQFELDKIEIECDRDKVLFLEGKTKDGAKTIIGSVSPRIAGCDQVPTNPIKKKLWDLRMKWMEKLKAKLNKKK